MDTLQLLANGFAIALQPTNLIFAIIGCFLGTLIGNLPGIGGSAGVAILIPMTFYLEPTAAIIMLAAIYYGSMYGGTITSILMNVPGEGSSAITCMEGYPMAKRGRAGAALSISVIGSFVGGTVATVGLVLLALPLTALALEFGPPEFFAMMIVALSLVTGLSGRSVVRALAAAVLGLLMAEVGYDPVVGAPRFTFGQVELLNGFKFVPVVLGLFGISEVLVTAEGRMQQMVETRLSSLMISGRDLRDSAWPIVRGTVVGFFLGLVPGVGGIVPTFIAYIVEKRFSKTPEKFGTGMIEGVAGPETANNAYANASMIPLFTLGVPGSATLAILMGAFIMNGLIPGPLLFREHPDFVWAVIASMYLGNVILVVMNLPLVPLWVAVMKIPYAILFALILLFCMVGAYSPDSSVFDVGEMLAFGVIGYLMKKLDFPIAPVVLTLIVGPLMERGLRQSLEMSQGDFSILFTRPISATLLVAAVLIILASAFRLGAAVRGKVE